MRDFKRLRQDPPQGVNGSPNPDNIMLWNAVIFGPEDTPWDGGKRWLGCMPAHATTQSAACTAALLLLTFCLLCVLLAVSSGTFKLTLDFTEDYPNKAPTVKFKSTMFHPNSKWVATGILPLLWQGLGLLLSMQLDHSEQQLQQPAVAARPACSLFKHICIHTSMLRYVVRTAADTHIQVPASVTLLCAQIASASACCCLLVPAPTVYADGGICLDILQNQWSPIYDVSAILTSIQVCSALATASLQCAPGAGAGFELATAGTFPGLQAGWDAGCGVFSAVLIYALALLVKQQCVSVTAHSGSKSWEWSGLQSPVLCCAVLCCAGLCPTGRSRACPACTGHQHISLQHQQQKQAGILSAGWLPS